MKRTKVQFAYIQDHKLTQTDTLLAKLYGLPKIHKIGFTLRPIISLLFTPTYDLAKIISKQLRIVFMRTKYSVDNSFQLKSLLKNIKVPPNYILVSFDARLLFTNITLQHIIETLNK